MTKVTEHSERKANNNNNNDRVVTIVTRPLANSRHAVLTDCPCCGHPMTADDIEPMLLPGIQRRIFEIVRNAGSAGIDRVTLTGRVYADHADGGPEWALNSVATTICQQINRKIKPFGLRIQGARGRHALYRLRRVSHET